ncbi:hypothetical protein PHMEG_00021977 [Phytophthora megakarya]|uniref:Uncharacterized protein n=1 Tax=Phytophthora megakarya TaxID=4795 RepID=A0A225VJY1_9STRA|nr:hypothetical protein PHMEG_00021977 [Phytophthora megakarya]
MLSVDAKRFQINDYLLEHDQNVIQSDVNNMVREHSSSVSAADDNEATVAKVAVFLTSDSSNDAGITENESGDYGTSDFEYKRICDHKKRKEDSARDKSDRFDRLRYSVAESGHKQAGKITLVELLNELKHEQSVLVETQRPLAGVLIRYHDAASIKPKFKRLKDPVLILDPFYILPPKLLRACVNVLHLGNTSDTAVDADGATNLFSIPTFMDASNRSDGKVDVVQLKTWGHILDSKLKCSIVWKT